MQEEVTQKTIALYVKVGKGAARLTEQALQKAIQKFLEQKSKPAHGKQTMRQLMKQNAGVSNIEITDSNIKAFESTAKKYNIDFSLKKVKGEQTRYLVFFKGRDADVMTAAFQEFSAKKLNREKKPSIRKALAAGQAVRLAPGADISAKILNIAQGFSEAFSNALPSVYPLDLLVGIIGAVVIRLIVYVKGKNAKKYRKGAEYGSARWGNAEDIKPYIDPEFQNNIILTQTERLTMNSRPKQPKYARNKNVVVIGGSGSGKTRFFVKPNLMQLHSSYVLTDPKGTVLIECGKLLQRAGYRIKVLNTINFKKSMHYNPFVYIRSEKDILKLVNTLIANTKGEGEKSAEDFWVKAERLLYCALVGYIWYEAPAEEMNFITLLELINASEAREDDEEYQSPVDLLFADLEERDPDHFAVKQYRKYKFLRCAACPFRYKGTPRSHVLRRIRT